MKSIRAYGHLTIVKSSDGFTIIQVMVALALTSIVALITAQLAENSFKVTRTANINAEIDNTIMSMNYAMRNSTTCRENMLLPSGITPIAVTLANARAGTADVDLSTRLPFETPTRADVNKKVILPTVGTVLPGNFTLTDVRIRNFRALGPSATATNFIADLVYTFDKRVGTLGGQFRYVITPVRVVLDGGTGAVLQCDSSVSVGNFTKQIVFDADAAWTIPLGIDKIRVEMWGAGGGGGSGNPNAKGMNVCEASNFCRNTHGEGGGGGGYLMTNVSVLSGTSITVIVGQGGAGANNGNGIGAAGGGSCIGTGIANCTGVAGTMARVPGGAGGASVENGAASDGGNGGGQADDDSTNYAANFYPNPNTDPETTAISGQKGARIDPGVPAFYKASTGPGGASPRGGLGGLPSGVTNGTTTTDGGIGGRPGGGGGPAADRGRRGGDGAGGRIVIYY